jgi:hypothetical protein
MRRGLGDCVTIFPQQFYAFSVGTRAATRDRCELTDDAISSFAGHLFYDTHVVLASPDLWRATQVA